MREETVRLVVEAVPKNPVPETERAVEEAKGAVNLVPSYVREVPLVMRVPS